MSSAEQPSQLLSSWDAWKTRKEEEKENTWGHEYPIQA